MHGRINERLKGGSEHVDTVPHPRSNPQRNCWSDRQSSGRVRSRTTSRKPLRSRVFGFATRPARLRCLLLLASYPTPPIRSLSACLALAALPNDTIFAYRSSVLGAVASQAQGRALPHACDSLSPPEPPCGVHCYIVALSNEPSGGHPLIRFRSVEVGRDSASICIASITQHVFGPLGPRSSSSHAQTKGKMACIGEILARGSNVWAWWRRLK